MIKTHKQSARRKLTSVATACLMGLAGCDAVRVPVVNPAGDQPEQPAIAPPSPDAGSEASGDIATPGVGADDPPPISETATTSAIPPTQPPEPTLPVSLPPITSLAAINAAQCGLPAEAPPTPTISVQAQATSGPQPESLITTQAVGAMSVQSLTAFPGIVKMEPRRFDGNAITSGHCSATRIAERWFLTAAHCVDDEYDEIQFIAGTTNLRDMASARVFTADTAICHAGYAGRDTNFLNDIALIRVPEDALTALTQVPIANFGSTDKPFGQHHYATADMAGWGMTGFNQPLSPLLLSAELNIVSASPSVIVIASRDGSGPCIGDSGGPLYVTEADGQRTVVGVLSVVEQFSGQNLCEGDYRGRYTNIAGYRSWIDTVIDRCASQPDLCDLALQIGPAIDETLVDGPGIGGLRPDPAEPLD